MKMVMPKMGMTMEEGTIVEWKKKEGEFVEKGEIILEIMTNKVNIDVEAPESGYLHILKTVDEIVPVNEPIAIIEKTTEERIRDLVDIPPATSNKEELEAHAAPSVTAESPISKRESEKIMASPRAKARAEREHISLETIRGTGPEEAITEKDVLQVLEQREMAKKSGEITEKKAAEQTGIEIETAEVIPEIRTEKPVSTGPVNASPLAERIAEDKGIDLSSVKGTGLDGKITKEDVLSYLETRKPEVGGAPVIQEEYERAGEEIEEEGAKEEIPEKMIETEKPLPEEITEKEEIPEEAGEEGTPVSREPPEPAPRIQPVDIPSGKSIPLAGIRKLTAERMSKSTREAPHLTLGMEADMTEATKLKTSLSVSYTDILIKAVAMALTVHPLLNATLSGDTIVIRDEINIGIAVARDEDLLVPVVHGADTCTLKEIAKITKDLITRTKGDELTEHDVLGGTFTISNLGMYDIEFFTPIINPPEAAILGVGAIQKKPVVCNDSIEIRERIMLSLSFDHRIINGMPAALFLREIKTLLEHPYRLLVEEES